jgi:radical SAM protein with 4Fe4S-binding SPASM domain
MIGKIDWKDIFLYSEDNDEALRDKLFLLYSPIARKAVWVDNDTAQKIKMNLPLSEQVQGIIDELIDFIPLKKQTQKVKQVEDYPLLTVLPNQKCNLTCSYCYSAKGRSTIELDRQKLKNAIDFFIDSKKEDKALAISYMGGGEPMLSWPLVSESILYAKKRALSQHKRIDFIIITNGTIMTKSIIDFIKEYKINISISFEIIEEIQNKQRGQYDRVVSTLQNLLVHGVIPQINSTITPDNVERMPEMYDLLDMNFPEIRQMMFEPVTSSELFPEGKDLSCFLKTYTRNFLVVDAKARTKGKSLTSFPYLRTVYPTERACAGEFCLTAEGKLSGCYCITAPVDPVYEKCIYGEVSAVDGSEKIVINKPVFERLLNENVYSKKRCEDCCVKWNCGGGCFYIFNSYPQTHQDVFCEFTRDYVQEIILNRYKLLYKKRFGVIPEENKEEIKKNPTLLSAI